VPGALREGYEVFFVSDCPAGATAETQSDAKTRMSMAGEPISWVAVTAEWAPDHSDMPSLVVQEVKACLSAAFGTRRSVFKA